MAARARKTELSESWKEKIQASMLMNRLKDHADGKIELSQTQLKAIDMILLRTVPSLSAVEQTTIEPETALTEAQIIENMKQFLVAHPEVLSDLLADKARQNPGLQPVSLAQQTPESGAQAGQLPINNGSKYGISR
jgi:hypothetical protein